MSDTVYNAQHYITFTLDEFLAMIVTSVFAGFMLSFDDWGDTVFDVGRGIQSWLLITMFLLFLFVITIWICKIVAIRMGYTLKYRAHIPGLMVGLFITVISRGYLPIFLPGGFTFDQPERLRIGKWHGYRKGWEMGLIAATFPLLMIVWVLAFNPLYLSSEATLYLRLVTACCLLAIYACVPIPFFESPTKGRAADVFRYLRGASFGLDVFYASGTGYIILTCTILVFSALAYLLTLLGGSVGIFIYILSLVLALIGLWIYRQFFKH